MYCDKMRAILCRILPNNASFCKILPRGEAMSRQRTPGIPPKFYRIATVLHKQGAKLARNGVLRQSYSILFDISVLGLLGKPATAVFSAIEAIHPPTHLVPASCMGSRLHGTFILQNILYIFHFSFQSTYYFHFQFEMFALAGSISIFYKLFFFIVITILHVCNRSFL